MNNEITTIKKNIEAHFGTLPEGKRVEMQVLHERILEVLPGTRLWFDEGKNAEGKVVTNPTIGYGFFTIHYANGSTRDFFQIGLCANTGGFSVYVLGLADKTYLAQTYGSSLGKAKITGYCIKFKSLKDIDLKVLDSAIRDGVEQTKV